MPTREYWINETIIATVWAAPLTAAELAACFTELATQISSQAQVTRILFDVRGTRTIPVQAPALAIRSGFLSQPNTGKVTVVSGDVIAQILANIASGITRHEIVFFSEYQAALDYLNASEA